MRKMQKSLRERIVAWVLTAAMVCGLLPTFSVSSGAANTELIPGETAVVAGGIYSLRPGSYAEKSIIIPEGSPVTIYIDGATTIDNTNGNGSPITILKGGTLNLYLNADLVVLGQSATSYTLNDDISIVTGGGHGGYAGIHVPSGSCLYMCGSGSLTAYGGNAAHGANGPSSGSRYYGGAGGAGAGIGGNGGNGGEGSDAVLIELSRIHGKSGEDAGVISIFNAQVTAFGGAGGSGGTFANSNPGASGGYPAAGIGGGGGGAGGSDHAGSGGGFSSGASEGNADVSAAGKDGQAGIGGSFSGGGGYFSAGYQGRLGSGFGLIGGGGWSYRTTQYANIGAGDGGAAGAGGNVTVNSQVQLRAYNGSYKTDDTESASYAMRNGSTWNTDYALNIFAQSGTIRAYYTGEYQNPWTDSVSRDIVPASQTEITAYGQGIGSGAGFQEKPNGDYREILSINIADDTLNTRSGETYYNRERGQQIRREDMTG